jgi:hypothetical protein
LRSYELAQVDEEMTMVALGDATKIASIAESIFVIISVLLIVIQLRKQTELARAANSQKAFELSSPFNLELIRDRDFARLWLKGPDASDELDQFRHETLLIWWLLLHENIYYQWKRGLLEKEAYLAWEQDLRDFVERTRLAQVWPTIQKFYQKTFAVHVSEIVGATPNIARKGAPNPGLRADD